MSDFPSRTSQKNISMAANFTSDPFKIETVNKVAVQIECLGPTIDGEFTLLSKNDNALNWVPVENSEVEVLGDSSIMIVHSDAIFDSLAVVYNRTAGTGTCSIFFNGKD